MLKVGFISLGCAKNLVDTEVMIGLVAQNMKITKHPEEADLIIINTCSFIDSAKEESITTILQMADYKKNGQCKYLIVAGCLGERYRNELLQEMPEIDAIVGAGALHRIKEAINAVVVGKRVVIIEENKVLYDHTYPRIRTTPKYSAYVKIAEGCSNCCTYCVIPSIRGPLKSRTIESVVAEVKMLVKEGVKEINLIAQDTTSFGRDHTGVPMLADLLKRLVGIEHLHWIRLLYCYPKYFTDELIDLIAKEPKICNYIDLPLQHIHDDILREMNRNDTKEEIESLLFKLKDKIPGVSIRTSLIVGFPGETDEQFNVLKEFIQRQRFDHVGVFPYSQEEGTPAGARLDQIPDEVKQERYHELMALQSTISEELNLEREGQILDVLVEGHLEDKQDVLFGRAYLQAPDVDGYLFIEDAKTATPGDVIKTRVVQGFTYDLLVKMI